MNFRFPSQDFHLKNRKWCAVPGYRIINSDNDISNLLTVPRKADQIQRQCLLLSPVSMAIEGDLQTIALAPNKDLLIHEGNSNSLLLQ